MESAVTTLMSEAKAVTHKYSLYNQTKCCVKNGINDTTAE